ncbi:hypothetical protein CRG98_037629 [Punica granatum]|uniref:Uncharacterized protein n=1 Tax=Punica granatum TaxID=22663 RepID=A0A2I0IDF2_PUNGR|nr:hypothetical protein CRG98_037629 [Punica granatum]
MVASMPSSLFDYLRLRLCKEGVPLDWALSLSKYNEEGPRSVLGSKKYGVSPWEIPFVQRATHGVSRWGTFVSRNLVITTPEC